LGFLILLRSTVTKEAGTLDRAIDMLRRLQQESDAYDATCLVIADWTDPPTFEGAGVRDDLVPSDLRADRFLATLIDRVLERTPIDMHIEVREAREHRQLRLGEIEEAGEASDTS